MANFTPVADPASIAAVQDIIKEVWTSDSIESQLYEDLVLHDMIESDVTEFTDSDGLKASVPVKVGRSAGHSARAIGEQLGRPSHPTTKKASYNYRFLYLQVQVYGPVVARMKTDRQSCVREINWEVENAILDFKKDYQRQLKGDGSASLLPSTIPGGGSSTTVLLGAANYDAILKGHLWEGQAIDIGTAANPVLDTGGNEIVTIVDNPAAPAITVKTATATTAGSSISKYANRDVANGSKEVTGIKKIASDTSVLGGLDPAVVRQWKGTRTHNSGTPRALSVDLLLTLRRQLRQVGQSPDLVYGDLVQEQKFWNLVQTPMRFNKGVEPGTGPLEASFGDLSYRSDAEADAGRIYMLRRKALQVYSAGKLSWQNVTTGGDILAWVQNFDAFQGRAAKYCELGTNHRSGIGVLEDLN